MQRMPVIDIDQARLVLTILRNRRRIKRNRLRPRPFQLVVDRVRRAKGAVDTAVHEDNHGRLVVWVVPYVRAEDRQRDAELVRGEVEDVCGCVVEGRGRGGPVAC